MTYRRPVAALAFVALAGLTGPTGCKKQNGETDLPQHYLDKDAALAAFDDPERAAWAKPDEVVDALGIAAPDQTVADIGAGSGYFSRRLAKKVPEGKVYAVDVDKDFGKFIEKHRDEWGTPNVEPRLALYENPLLPAGEVDYVFVSNTYAFIRDRVTYFSAVAGSLRDDGRLAVIDFREDASCEGVDTCPKPSQRDSRDDAVAELEKAGFSLVEEHDFLPHQYFLIMRKNP